MRYDDDEDYYSSDDFNDDIDEMYRKEYGFEDAPDFQRIPKSKKRDEFGGGRVDKKNKSRKIRDLRKNTRNIRDE